MSARGAKFPFGTTRQSAGYALEITVHPGPQHIRVRPPAALGGGGSHGCWPTTAFQALLVASEYCAAVQELLSWAFPSPAWDDYKPMVAQFAAEFISSAAPVPVSAATAPAGAQLDPVLLHCSHSLWSNFTFLYFHGTRDLNLEGLGTETRQAAQWLKRLVGDRGWAPDGLVFSAARTWTEASKARLAPLFPTVPGFTTPAPAPLSATGGTPAEVQALHQRTWAGCPERELVERVEKGGGDGQYYPVYPYRITSGYAANRIKFTMQRVSAPRSIKGSCGVPADYGQSHNCALGYLLLADVMQAFNQASKQWGNSDGADDVTTIDHFINNVLLHDTKPLLNLHGITRYGTFLAGCALGWVPALEQVRGWVKAAADALPEVAAGNTPPQLVLPASLTPAVIQAMAAVVQQVPVAAAQPQPQPPQPQVPQPQPQLQLPQPTAAQPQQQPLQPPQQPHLAHVVQLPNAASGGSIVSGPPTGSSGGSGTGRSPFAALQQVHQQLQAPTLVPPPHAAGVAAGAAGGPGPQLPQLPDLPQLPPAPAHPESSPSAEDVAGGMSNMSLDGPTFGDETLAALAADMRSLKEADLAGMGRQHSAALAAHAGHAGPGPSPLGPNGPAAAVGTAGTLGGVDAKGGEGVAAATAAAGPFSALAVMNQLQGFGAPGPSGRTVTTSAPGPVQQPQHLPHNAAQAHAQQLLLQQQQAQAAKAAAATAVAKVVELLGSASNIMAQLAAAPAHVLEPSVQARLGALVRGQEEALRAFRLEFNLPAGGPGVLGAAAAGPSASGGGGGAWPPAEPSHGLPGPTAVASAGSAGAPLPPPGPHAPTAGGAAGVPGRASGSPFERLVRMPGTAGTTASAGQGQQQPALSAGGGSSGGGRNSLPGLVPGAFGAAAPAATAAVAAAPSALKLAGAAEPGTAQPQNPVAGAGGGPAAGPGPAGASPPSSGGAPASSGSAGNISGSTLGLLGAFGENTAGGDNMSLMLQLMEGGNGGGETLGGGNVSLMSLGNDSLLGLDGNGTLGLGLGQAGVDAMGSEGALINTAGAAAGGGGMEAQGVGAGAGPGPAGH